MAYYDPNMVKHAFDFFYGNYQSTWLDDLLQDYLRSYRLSMCKGWSK